jgi:hypothetical protein
MCLRLIDLSIKSDFFYNLPESPVFFYSATERLAQLQPLLQQWKTLDNRLEQLQVDLRSDEKTLHLLDTALQGGALSDQTASYVRDVAKLLSETTTVQVRYFKLSTSESRQQTARCSKLVSNFNF